MEKKNYEEVKMIITKVEYDDIHNEIDRVVAENTALRGDSKTLVEYIESKPPYSFFSEQKTKKETRIYSTDKLVTTTLDKLNREKSKNDDLLNQIKELKHEKSNLSGIVEELKTKLEFILNLSFLKFIKYKKEVDENK